MLIPYILGSNKDQVLGFVALWAGDALAVAMNKLDRLNDEVTNPEGLEEDLAALRKVGEPLGLEGLRRLAEDTLEASETVEARAVRRHVLTRQIHALGKIIQDIVNKRFDAVLDLLRREIADEEGMFADLAVDDEQEAHNLARQKVLRYHKTNLEILRSIVALLELD